MPFIDDVTWNKIRVSLEKELAKPEEPKAPQLHGCACRWDGDNPVEVCKLHAGWRDVIGEWADRARRAEAELTDARARAAVAADRTTTHQPEAQPTQEQVKWRNGCDKTVPAALHDIDAGIEVMAWLRESHAPHSIYSKMSSCLFGDPDKKPQPEQCYCDELRDILRSTTDLLQKFIEDQPPYDEVNEDTAVLKAARAAIKATHHIKD